MRIRARLPVTTTLPHARPLLRAILGAAGDIVYPRRCVSCGAFDIDLCERCVEVMATTSGPGHCGFCQAPWAGDDFCTSCAGWDALEGARAPFEMTGPARRVVHALKYTGVRSMAPIMAAHVAPLFAGLRADAAVAVPLHDRRRKERGFNQSEEILSALDWPRGEGRLRRVRRTRSQVGMTEQERRRNVAGAFSYEGPDLRGLTVLLLDDVVTTGATANECARVLRDHGASKVYAVAFARAGGASRD